MIQKLPKKTVMTVTVMSQRALIPLTREPCARSESGCSNLWTVQRSISLSKKLKPSAFL